MINIIVSIHQPNFLPYMGYFNKIRSSDIFILYDDAQYVKNRWDNRNRIRNKEDFTYITIPLRSKDCFKKKFLDIPLPPDEKWKKKHKLKLQSCYSRSPFFKDYFPLIEKIYDSDYNNLADFNYEFITFLNKSFNINTEIIKSSNINIKESLFSSRFLSEAVRKVGGDTYLSGPSGSDYINKKDFESNGIKLIFQKYRCKDYKQIFPGFVSNLSAIDLLFNMGPDSQNFV